MLLEKLRTARVEAELNEMAGQLHAYPLLPTAVGAAARSRITTDLRDALNG